MKYWRIIIGLIILTLGAGLGLIYGWVLDPVEYVNTSPETLRIDYRTDIVLMVSEIYSHDSSIQDALDRLSWVDDRNSARSVNECVNYAEQMNFSGQDISQLQNLYTAISVLEQQGTVQP